jgi:Domain of unknown function (DUF4279)
MNPQISARFSLRGRFEPDDVTRHIGLQPTKTWRRGDMRTRVRAWGWDGWAIELDPEDSVDLPQMTERLLAILEPFVTAINTARERWGLSSHLSLIALTTDTSPAIHFVPHVLSSLVHIGVELDVDVWLLRDDADEQVVTFGDDAETPLPD